MTLGHFWPLVAEKAKKPNSEICKKLVFGLFQPSEAKNDPDTENTKQPDFDQNCLVFSMSGSFLASGG